MAYKYNRTSEELNIGGFDCPIKGDYHYINIGQTTVLQLQKAGVIPTLSYKDLTSHKPDGIILMGKNTVKVLVEWKKNGSINNEVEALDVLTDWYFDLAKVVGCKILCSTDGRNYFWFNVDKKIIKNTNGQALKTNFNICDITDNKLTIESANEIISMITKMENLDEEATILEEKVLNPQSLANKVWQKIWINTGKEPEKCLYNVVEIFIFKFLSDLGILEDEMSFKHVYDISKSKGKDCNKRALNVYAKNIRTEIKDEMFPKSEIDGTTIFNGTIFVNEDGHPNLAQAGLFVEVLEEFANYEKEYGSFKNIDKQFKTRLYESFLRKSAGISALGQYFTPRNVVVSIINMINPDTIPENAKICDPFCGVGGFLLELLNQVPKLKDNYKPQAGKIVPKIELLGYDKGSDEKDDERTIILAKANMLIYFSDLIAKYKDMETMKEFSTKVFNKVFHLVKTNLGTFGIDKYENYFDLIVTNPPYVTSGVSSIKKAIEDNGLSYIYPSKGNGLEGLAIEWIIRALKPGGQAYIVVPDGLLSRQADKTLRDNIIKNCYLDAIISLPTRTFFATPKKTYILALRKKNAQEEQLTPVFTYLVSEIGETRDAKRFEEPDKNNLIDMVKSFKQFMVLKNDYHSNNLRCKIQGIDRFKNLHWLVDRDWLDDEKKLLGIADETTEMNESEFYSLLADIKKELDNNHENIKLDNISTEQVALTDNKYFKIEQNKLGYTEAKYRELDTKNENDIPLYTAKLNPVAYIEKVSSKIFVANEDNPLISFADDGDGTAGTNIVFHTKDFYNNTSRKILKILDKNIYPKYIYYLLLDMKQKYGFDYKYKCNVENLSNVYIEIPVKNDKSFDLSKQQEIAKKYEAIYKKRNDILNLLRQIEQTQIKIDF